MRLALLCSFTDTPPPKTFSWGGGGGGHSINLASKRTDCLGKLFTNPTKLIRLLGNGPTCNMYVMPASQTDSTKDFRCVCVCVRACVRACVCVSVRARYAETVVCLD